MMRARAGFGGSFLGGVKKKDARFMQARRYNEAPFVTLPKADFLANDGFKKDGERLRLVFVG